MAEGLCLRAGVVGVGHLGMLHSAKYAAAADVDLVAVHDLSPERARAAAARFGCASAPSLEALLESVDVVSVAVPAGAHLEVGARVIAARLPMLIEKPLAPSSEQARVLAAAAKRTGSIVQVGHLERFNPVFVDVHGMIDRPRFLECHRLAPFAGRGIDTDVVFDVMIHDLDLILYLVGQRVARVEAVGVAVVSPHVDIANARIRFEGGCIANVTASRVSLKRERKLRVFQEDAYVSVDFDAGHATIARKTTDRSREGAPPDIAVEQRDFGVVDPLGAEINEFLSCVREGRPPAVGVDAALEALELADAVVESLETPDAGA